MMLCWYLKQYFKITGLKESLHRYWTMHLDVKLHYCTWTWRVDNNLHAGTNIIANEWSRHVATWLVCGCRTRSSRTGAHLLHKQVSVFFNQRAVKAFWHPHPVGSHSPSTEIGFLHSIHTKFNVIRSRYHRDAADVYRRAKSYWICKLLFADFISFHC